MTKNKKSSYLRDIFIAKPIILLLIGVVIGFQLFQRFWQSKVNEATDSEYKWWFGKLGFAFNAIAVIIFGKINMKVCVWLTDGENYRYMNEYEDALIRKVYMFNFINAYISNYLLAFWSQNFRGIAENLLIIMVFK